jgi:glycine cleavage system regulatory protein
MSALIPSSDVELQRFMLYRRSTALSQISYTAKEMNLLEKSLSLAQESLTLALQLYDTNPPKSHIDYETYTRSVILAYQLVGDRLAFLPERRHEGKEMYLKSLEIAEQLYSSSRRESNQIGVLMKDSLMSLLSVSAVDNDHDEVSKWIAQIKQNALNLLTEEDYRLVLYYESQFTSMAAAAAAPQKKRPQHKQRQQQAQEL